MFAEAYLLWKRQDGGLSGDGNNDDGSYNDGSDDTPFYSPDANVSWWWTPSGMAVRYAIVALLFAAVLLFFVGGYYHARRRLRKGLPLLAYHRWMVQRRGYDPEARYMTHQQPGHTYVMSDYPPPPPAYNPHDAPPPVYQPPEGGSKVLADQNYTSVQPVAATGETSHSMSGAQPAPAATAIATRE
jgi:hypothetical protein